MAFDEELAERVLGALGARADIDPKRIERKTMFGGVAYLVDGAMCVGVQGDEIVARVSAADGDRYLTERGVRPMDFTGRPMRGWLYVGGPAIATDAALGAWIERCVAFTDARPAPKAKAAKAKAIPTQAKAKPAAKPRAR